MATEKKCSENSENRHTDTSLFRLRVVMTKVKLKRVREEEEEDKLGRFYLGSRDRLSSCPNVGLLIHKLQAHFLVLNSHYFKQGFEIKATRPGSSRPCPSRALLKVVLLNDIEIKEQQNG